MHDAGGDADVVFVGLMTPEPGGEADYAARLIEMAGGLPTTIFDRNGSPFRGWVLQTDRRVCRRPRHDSRKRRHRLVTCHFGF